MIPFPKCVRVISRPGRYGSEMDAKKLRTNAMKRKATPEAQNARAIVVVVVVGGIALYTPIGVNFFRIRCTFNHSPTLELLL